MIHIIPGVPQENYEEILDDNLEIKEVSYAIGMMSDENWKSRGLRQSHHLQNRGYP